MELSRKRWLFFYCLIYHIWYIGQIKKKYHQILLDKPLAGLEPATSSLPWMRSTCWAKAAIYNFTPQVGLEPTTSWLTVMRSASWAIAESRQSHPAWQRPTLTGPKVQLPSALRSLTSVFGMGTGVSFLPLSPHLGVVLYWVLAHSKLNNLKPNLKSCG